MNLWDGSEAGGLQARVAQLVEQLICNQLVGGSSPFSGSWEAGASRKTLEMGWGPQSKWASSQVANGNRL
jgi:hypothetical protein